MIYIKEIKPYFNNKMKLNSKKNFFAKLLHFYLFCSGKFLLILIFFSKFAEILLVLNCFIKIRVGYFNMNNKNLL